MYSDMVPRSTFVKLLVEIDRSKAARKLASGPTRIHCHVKSLQDHTMDCVAMG